MDACRSATLRKTPRRMALLSKWPNHLSARFNQLELVGTKWDTNRGLRFSHAFTFACLCVPISTADGLVVQVAKPSLGKIQPTGTGGDEVGYEPRIAFQPCLYLRVLVRADLHGGWPCCPSGQTISRQDSTNWNWWGRSGIRTEDCVSAMPLPSRACACRSCP